MEDRYNLERFVEAQSGVYTDVLAELRQGRKTSHWMWFIFPQFKGFGSSPMAVRFAINSIDEAEAYLRHPVLGSRLRECCRLLLEIQGLSIDRILGYPDNLKLRSSLTLFSRAAKENEIFLQLLARYFEGLPDPITLEALLSDLSVQK